MINRKQTSYILRKEKKSQQREFRVKKTCTHTHGAREAGMESEQAKETSL